MVCLYLSYVSFFFFFKQKTAYEMRISDWSSDVCSSDLDGLYRLLPVRRGVADILAARPLDGGEAVPKRGDHVARIVDRQCRLGQEIGRASCRERVCQYV